MAMEPSSSFKQADHTQDFQPVVALKAVGAPPTEPANHLQTISGKNEFGRTGAGSSSPTFQPPPTAAGPVSRPADASPPPAQCSAPLPATPVVKNRASVPANSMGKGLTKSSNPKVIEVMKLKSGMLDVISTSIAPAIGLPPGPVSALNFRDPVVVKFFHPEVVSKFLQVHDSRPVLQSNSMDNGVQNVVNAHTVENVERLGLEKDIQNVDSRHITAAVVDPNCSRKDMADVGNVDGCGMVANSMVNPSLMAAKSLDNPSSPQPLSPSAVDFPPLMNVVSRQTTLSSVVAPLQPQISPSSVEVPPPQQPSAVDKAPWVGLFKNNRVLLDDTKMQSNLVGVTVDKVVLVDDDLYDDDEEKRSLIGFFNGKFPGLKSVQQIVDDWSRKCTFHLHNSGWLVFTFEDVRDLDVVLKEGPYYAFGKPLVLKQMPEFFDFSDDAYSTAPVWIQLPNLPMRVWKKEALEKICSFLGAPLHIDLVTKEKTELSFARCLVDIDVSKDLPETVCVDLPRGTVLNQYVLYEKVPTFCTNCKKLGHETEDCYANANGKPSLYVARSSKDKKEKHKSAQWQGTGKVHGNVGKSGARPQAGNGKSGAHPQASKGKSVGPGTGQNSGKVSETAGRGDVSAGDGSAEVGDRTTHAVVTGQAAQSSVLNSKNGNSDPSNAQGTGVVSANPFGALATEKGSSWVNEAEVEGALITNKKNGRKK